MTTDPSTTQQVINEATTPVSDPPKKELTLVEQARLRLAEEAKAEEERKAREADAKEAEELLRESNRLAAEREAVKKREAETKARLIAEEGQRRLREAAAAEEKRKMAEADQKRAAAAAELERQRAAAAAAQDRINTATQKFRRWDGFNASGGDLGSATRGATENACALACLDDARCIYYSYGKTGQVCYLKGGETNREIDLLTGIKGTNKTYARVDIPTNQVAYDNGLASQSICSAKCASNPRCQHYTWRNQGAGCWQKQAGNDPSYVTGYKIV
jgi:hypothetical protein